MDYDERITLHLPPSHRASAETLRSLPQATIMALARRSIGATAADLLLSVRSLESLDLSEDVEEWAEERLFNAVGGWNKYSDTPALKDWCLPMNTKELREKIPDLAEQLSKLYMAVSKAEMEDASEILLVPYGVMAKHKDDFMEQLKQLRAHDGLQPDDMSKQISTAMTDYSRPLQYDYFDYLDFTSRINMTMSEYMTHVTADGDWGLVAVGKPHNFGAGAARMRNSRDFSNDEMHFKGFGVPEWLAYTLQMHSSDNHERLVLNGSLLSATNVDISFAAISGFDSEHNCHTLQLQPDTSTSYSTTSVLTHNARA